MNSAVCRDPRGADLAHPIVNLKQQVRKVFEEVERSALAPLPRERFPNFREAQRKVNRDGHIEVAKA